MQQNYVTVMYSEGTTQPNTPLSAKCTLCYKKDYDPTSNDNFATVVVRFR